VSTEKRTTYVWVTASFVAFHRWAKAPDHVAFLRDFHRHIFNVKVHVPVTHADRDVEFFMFKKDLESFLTLRFADRRHDMSCEMFASAILDEFPGIQSAQVDEDGENGALVVREAA
jgi:hypothetical protein